MDKTLKYHLKTTPGDILTIAKDRVSGFPGISLSGDNDAGCFRGRGFDGNYRMKPVRNGADLTLTFSKKPPVPWFIVKRYFDSQAEKW